MKHARRFGVVAAIGIGTGCFAPAAEQAAEGGDDGAVAVRATASALRRAVDPAKELVITDPSVVESSLETTYDDSALSGNTPRGAWSFGRLVHDMLPRPERGNARALSAAVTAWLRHWSAPQSPNPAVSPADARPAIDLAVLGPWRTASGCAVADEGCVLDMRKAPFRLIAIVNRPDLRIVTDDDRATGGEGRFVFQLVGPTVGLRSVGGPLEIVDPAPTPQKFTVIFEYALPVRKNAETARWAERWHALGAQEFGPRFNAALRAITEDFAGADADRRRPNGNALNQLRTNEVVTQGARRFGVEAPLSTPQIWELREFRISATTGRLAQQTVNLEPSRDFDIARAASAATFRAPFGSRGGELAGWLLENADAVSAGKYAFPPAMAGNSSLVGGGGFGPWGKLSTSGAHTLSTTTDPPVSVPDAVRDRFALETCAGCHRHETGTVHFMHLSDRRAIDAVDVATLALPPATTPAEERAVIISPFLGREIATPSAELPRGGPRYEDFTELVELDPRDLRPPRHRASCR